MYMCQPCSLSQDAQQCLFLKGLPIDGMMACSATGVCQSCICIAAQCVALASLQQQRADLLTPCADTVRSSLAQQDHKMHLGYEIRYKMFGTLKNKTLLP